MMIVATFAVSNSTTFPTFCNYMGFFWRKMCEFDFFFECTLSHHCFIICEGMNNFIYHMNDLINARCREFRVQM